jgi:hypothetical protein
VADASAKASVFTPRAVGGGGFVAAANASVFAVVREVTETVVREVQQMDLTADEVGRVRYILESSQAAGDESPITEQLAAQVPKLAGLFDWMLSQPGVAVGTWILVFLMVWSLMFPPDAQHPVTPAPVQVVQAVTPAQIEEIVEQVAKDLDQPPQAPPEPTSPPTT